MKTIYELKLHETGFYKDFSVLRVPGGWIYRYWDYGNEDYYADSIFVPYDNEFIKLNEDIELPSASDQIRPITTGELKIKRPFGQDKPTQI